MRQFGAIVGFSSVTGLGAVIAAGALLFAAPARAQTCPGNPDAIGTSRVLTLAPGEVSRVGKIQYPDTLPLNDHEVVLTFDDGPLPPYTDKILDILASQCVKATFFMVGEMAKSFPTTARHVYQEGHTIGTHSENHPTHFGELPIDKMRWEIDEGIAHVAAALGSTEDIAPFFRIPGFARSDVLERELAARSLVVFSADAVADDWHRHIKPAQIIARAMSRLEARGGGILLLHDIHPATVAALPGLLKALKENGFHIVQLVPARPGAPPAVAGPAEDIAGPAEETVAWTPAGQAAMDDSAAVPDWPQPDLGAPVAASLAALPVPDVNAFDVGAVLAPHVSSGDIEASLPSPATAGADDAATPWPDQALATPTSVAPELPEPSVADIGFPVLPPASVDAASMPKPSVEPVSAASVSKPNVKPVGVAAHAVLRHRLRWHRHAHAPAAAGQHASLFSALAALLTPASASPRPQSRTSRNF
jgi:peptidoglycan/xylan/chitin deacetylase (PgdA/CDA1 family)